MITDKQHRLYIDRINKFIKRMTGYVFAGHVQMQAKYMHSNDPVPFSERLDGEYVAIKEGEKWGSAWESAWFRLEGCIPNEWAGRKIVANLDFNGEALVFSDAGLPLQGLTNGSVFSAGFTRDVFPVSDCAKGGESVGLWIEAAANRIMGISMEADPAPGSPDRHGTFTGVVNKIRLCVFDDELYHLWLDYDLFANMLKYLPENGARYVRILKALSDGIDSFSDNISNAGRVRGEIAHLYNKKANASAVTVNAVGHAHIDTGWLWPVRETIRKSARTFSSQLALLDQYDFYVFGASQPAHYQMVKQHYPDLYAKIKEAVKGGRWEPQGGMWVEADCNLISGESMVRQILHGKNFFMDEFGVDTKNLWLPDVFGYSAAMPQILKKAGIDYFLTQKLSWSQFNKFPYTTFRWRGIDGTEVLTHFPPENTYNSSLQPVGMQKAEDNFVEKDVLDEMMVLFGIGDGGGGPTANMIEHGIRQADLEGVPKIRFGRADKFFERLAKHEQELPLWVGELYLELHRGTLTTQSRIKRLNRQLEHKLRETEYLFSCAPLDKYPGDVLDAVWKTMLLNQFHDIIPGSSIHKVYEVAEKEYSEALEKCRKLQECAAAELFEADANSLVIVNTLNTPFNRPVVLPEGWDCGLADENGADLPVQMEKGGCAVVGINLKPQGIVTLSKKGACGICHGGSGLVLENEVVSYQFSDNGEIVKAWDKAANRAILSGGCPGNVLTLYEDRPVNWDAWDIDIFYESQALETASAFSHERVASGPVRQGICFRLTVGSSEITQKVYLQTGSRRLDFVTDVVWNERHRMLRVAFPTSVRADQASFDIQYGYVRRNTHRNLSWDMARFEVAAHKYVDLSEGNYGVALLNDCKYGHKILDNVIDLNLLRAPTYPDADADLGLHSFTYSLLPHSGNLIDSNVIGEAAQLNQPPAVFASVSAVSMKVPVSVEGEGAGLEVLKKGGKDDCLVIRIVEKFGCETTATIVPDEPSARVVETDIMEWKQKKDFGAGAVTVSLSPFDIRTFKILR